MDKSVLKVADLPKGYQATRRIKNDKWEIVKIEYSTQEISEMGFQCSTCGHFHKEKPMAYGADAPYPYAEIPEDQHDKRCELTQDICILDNKLFFIKGNLLINVEGKEEFSWNVWVSISKKDYERMEELWTDENRILENPYNGSLASHLEPYPETLNLPVKVYTQRIGFRPKIEVIETSHSLFLEQENGINMERVISFARQILYQHY